MDLIGNQSALPQSSINNVMFMNIDTIGGLLAQGTDMLAFRNLLHDRVRFIVPLAGLVFPVVLSAVQFGLFLGFTRATVDATDRSNTDLRVASKGVTHLESGVPFHESLTHMAPGAEGRKETGSWLPRCM